VINGQSGKIVCVIEAKGSVHDFQMFKQSGIHLLDDILCVGDKGFQGICKLHAFSVTPFKKPKAGELTDEQKVFNRNISKYRIRIEHVNRRINLFKIFKYCYRNKQKKHLLRFSLICGIYRIMDLGQVKIIITLCTQSTFDKLPKTFNQIEIRAIWRYVYKVNAKL
jgi:hypothetical protein